MDKIVITKTSSLVKKLLNYIFYYFKIVFTVLFNNYDIIYVHYAGQNSLPFYFLTKIKKINLIFNLHGSDVIAEKRIHTLLLALTKRVVKKCNKIVVPSEYYKDIVNAEFEVSKDKIFVFPSSGINEKIFFPKNKITARQKISINVNEPLKIIGYVGRIEFGKGWDVLLDSIWILHDKGIINPTNYQFIFVGDGKESLAFSDKVKELSIDEYVLRIPAIPQASLGDYYNSFDLFCFPTKRKSESLGLVGLEALACGIPVIASDFAAPKYYIKNGYNGYKFEVNSAVELANRIDLYFNLDTEEQKKIVKNSIDSSIPYRKSAITHKLLNEILKI